MKTTIRALTAHALTATKVKNGSSLYLVGDGRVKASDPAGTQIGVALEDCQKGGIVKFVIKTGASKRDLSGIRRVALAAYALRVEMLFEGLRKK